MNMLTGPDGTHFCWLNGIGMAGSGKSAVAQSVAQFFARQGRFAGSFFFSRATADRRNPQRLVPTITYQLMVSVSSLKSFILGVLEDDSSICVKAPCYQLQNLIVGPLLKLLRPL